MTEIMNLFDSLQDFNGSAYTKITVLSRSESLIFCL
jgi:hypothetical protein